MSISVWSETEVKKRKDQGEVLKLSRMGVGGEGKMKILPRTFRTFQDVYELSDNVLHPYPQASIFSHTLI